MMIITCPGCGITTKWEPQPRETKVKCYNREMTGTIRGKPQKAFAMYGTTDGTKCWMEEYIMDLPQREPRWFCGEEFLVRA